MVKLKFGQKENNESSDKELTPELDMKRKPDDPEFGGRRQAETVENNETLVDGDITSDDALNIKLEDKQELSDESPKELVKAKPLGGALGFVNETYASGQSLDVKDIVRKPVRFGMVFFIILFVFIGGWAAFAPLNSAAIAMGKVVLDANRKLIQHLEGGIIDTLHVRDGDEVRAGDLLVTMDKTKPQANWEILTGQLIVAEALEDRLLSERDGLQEVEFRSSLLDKVKTNAEAKKNLDVQTRLFVSRSDTLAGQVAVLTQRIKQFRDEISGLEAQKDATNKQLDLINEEILSVKKLVKDGLAQKPRLLSLQREAARLLGSRGEFMALIARAGQSITENELSILNLRNERGGEIVAELRQVQTEIADIRERVRAAIDVLERTEIVAPRSGIITNMHFHTQGGVVAPGQEMLSIIPQDDELLLEAQVKPTDIDLVRPGLISHVRLSAYKARTVPTLEGEVISVSPDSFIDEMTGVPYYSARVRINEHSIARLTEDIQLYPGMPVEVLIVTGSKTPLGYLMDPLTSYFNKAMREE